MAFEAKAGSFAINTSTGNQSVSGLGFQPKVVLFFPTVQTADGVGVNAQLSMGFGISSSNRWAVTANEEDAQDTSDAHSEKALIAGLVDTPGENTAIYEFDFVSQDSDGFTVNVTTAPGSAYLVGYLALGGTDLTNVASSSFAAPTSTGNVSVTGVGFEPDAVLLFATFNVNGAPSDSVHGTVSFGMAISSSQRGAQMIKWRDARPSSDVAVYQRSDRCFVMVNLNNSLNSEADFVSMDSDGFTINWSAVGAQAWTIRYLALKGGQYAIGQVATQTSTGTFAETGVGFQPVAGLFTSVMQPASASIDGSNGKIVLGVASGTTERFTAGATSEDNQAISDTDNFVDTAALYQSYDYAQTLTGEIDLSSWDSDGFTLDQIDADPAGNEILYLVFGSEPGGVSDLSVSVSDSVSVSESVVSTVSDLQVIAADSITVAETVTVTIPVEGTLLVSVAESIAITEFITLFALGTTAEILLSPVDDPIIHTGHTVRVREQVLDGTGDAEALDVYLYQGSTLIAQVFDNIGTRDVWTTHEYTLSEGEAASITDYSDLRLRFVVDTLGSGETFQVSWVELEVPIVVESLVVVIVSDSIGTAEAVSLAVSDPQVTAVDAIAVSEVVAVSLLSFIAVEDTVSIAAMATATASDPQIVASDTVTVAEVIALGLDSFVAVSDAIAIAEVVVATVSDPAASVADSIAVADSASLSLLSFISVANAVSVAETVTADVSDPQIVAVDAIALAETTASVVSDPQVVVTDAIAAVEVIALSLDSTIAVADALSIDETVTASLVSFIAVSDTVTVTDSVALTQGYNVTVADTAGVAEVVIATVSDPQVLVADAIAVVDEANVFVTVEGVLAISVSDLVTIVETAIAQVSDPQIAVSDASTVLDTVAVVVIVSVLVADTITIVETVTLELSTLVSVADAISVAEATTAVVSDPLLSVADSVTVVDEATVFVTVSGVVFVSVSDLATIAETVTATVGDPQVAAADAISVVDTAIVVITATGILSVSVADTVAIAETTVAELLSFIAALESITVTDSPALDVPVGIAVADAMALVDTGTAVVSAPQVGVSEVITVAETITTAIIALGVIEGRLFKGMYRGMFRNMH